MQVVWEGTSSLNMGEKKKKRDLVSSHSMGWLKAALLDVNSDSPIGAFVSTWNEKIFCPMCFCSMKKEQNKSPLLCPVYVLFSYSLVLYRFVFH